MAGIGNEYCLENRSFSHENGWIINIYIIVWVTTVLNS